MNDIIKIDVGVWVQLDPSYKLKYADPKDIEKALLAITEEEWNEYINAWYRLEANFRAWKQERNK